MTPRVRAYRILNSLSSYDDLASSQSSPDWIAEIDLEPEEEVLGVYRNTPSQDQAVIVTTRALHIGVGTKWHHVSYHEIEASATNSKEKGEADHLIVRTRSGVVIKVPVKGGSDRFQDVYEFQRYLDRVTSDLG